MYSDSVKAAATPTSLNRESWRSMVYATLSVAILKDLFISSGHED